MPKAERDAEARATAGAGPSAGAPRSSHASASDLAGELAEQAMKTGRAVADGAVKAGTGVAKQALEVGREAADGLIRRVNRKLDDSDRR